MTVIVSIFIWGLLIGGLLGPLLAIPLTATIKVLLARYVWGPRLREEVMENIEEVPVVEDEEPSPSRLVRRPAPFRLSSRVWRRSRLIFGPMSPEAGLLPRTPLPERR